MLNDAGVRVKCSKILVKVFGNITIFFIFALDNNSVFY